MEGKDSIVGHSTDETFQSLGSGNFIGGSTAGGSGNVTPKPMSTIGGNQVTNMPATDVFGVQSMNLNQRGVNKKANRITTSKDKVKAVQALKQRQFSLDFDQLNTPSSPFMGNK